MTSPLAQARRADTQRRRERVLSLLNDPRGLPDESVAGIARAAGVHRSFLYRHPDLLAAALARVANPPDRPDGSHASRASLLTDLANLAERNTRLVQQVEKLEAALSLALGNALWQQTGIGAPPVAEALQQRIDELEQLLLDVRQQLEERDEELDAARATNRQLLARTNRSTPGH